MPPLLIRPAVDPMVESRSDYSEDLRQIEHLVPIAFAFLLPYLTWGQAVALAVCALVYGVFISPRLLRVTRRPNEEIRGFSSGKAAYALSVLGLLLVFPHEFYIVAAVWANLSVGDAASNLIGRNFGRKTIPWNVRKTWLGFSAALFSSTLAAGALMLWVGVPPGASASSSIVWSYALSVSVVCSLVETLPLPVDDNLTICLAGGAFLGWLSRTSWPAGWNWQELAIGLLVSTVVGLPAWLLKTVSRSGAAWGILFGTVVYYALGFGGFILLGTFFILGSLFSKMGYDKKMREGLAQEDHGRRSGRHVWGKGAAALMAAIASLFLVDQSLILLAFVSALASSLSDTTATELGQLAGSEPILLTNFKRVPRGTPGAVSVVGSISGVLAALFIAIEGYVLHFVTPMGVLWAVLAAVAASHLEGFLVARHRGPRVSGPLMNAFHTTISMLIVVLLARIR